MSSSASDDTFSASVMWARPRHDAEPAPPTPRSEITIRVNLQFRGEFFNLSNHPNFSIGDNFVCLGAASWTRKLQTTQLCFLVSIGLGKGDSTGMKGPPGKYP